MLGYKETMVLLDEMKPHYDDGFTSSERSTIENLYNTICRKPIRRSGCSDCYRDAYIEVVTTFKRLGKMPKTPLYVLKAGAVLHEFGSADFYTLGNIPEEFADKWLAKRPEDIKLFEQYPADWQERAQKAINGIGAPSEDNGNAEHKDTVDGDSEDHVDATGAPSEEQKPTVRRGRPASK
nr:MAG TPA: hypothetical protein [Caudoviricetes sp.]